MRKSLRVFSLFTIVIYSLIINSCNPLMKDLEFEKKNKFNGNIEIIPAEIIDTVQSGTSSNPDVCDVSVDSNGKLKINIKNPGTATINATDNQGTEKAITLTINDDGSFVYTYTDDQGNNCTYEKSVSNDNTVVETITKKNASGATVCQGEKITNPDGTKTETSVEKDSEGNVTKKYTKEVNSITGEVNEKTSVFTKDGDNDVETITENIVTTDGSVIARESTVTTSNSDPIIVTVISTERKTKADGDVIITKVNQTSSTPAGENQITTTNTTTTTTAVETSGVVSIQETKETGKKTNADGEVTDPGTTTTSKTELNSDGTTTVVAVLGNENGITLTLPAKTPTEVNVYLTIESSTYKYNVDSTYNNKCYWYVDGTKISTLTETEAGRTEVPVRTNTYSLDINDFTTGNHSLMVVVSDSETGKSYSKTVYFAVTR